MLIDIPRGPAPLSPEEIFGPVEKRHSYCLLKVAFRLPGQAHFCVAPAGVRYPRLDFLIARP